MMLMSTRLLTLLPWESSITSSRVFLQEGIYDELMKKLQVKAKDWVVGDPFHQGPQRGATLLTGGKPVGKKGYYIEPTVFTVVKDDMLIAKDDIFGPVVSLMKFKTIEEGVARANNTKYGLAAGIVTKNIMWLTPSQDQSAQALYGSTATLPSTGTYKSPRNVSQ
ncbi:putative oxidoreductase [Rosa chinensis]|uniref:Putative oxidoreductase n=1 Tax=Rosa chinensis TaxID=74649 RepID=A0A2P6RGE9_ROSCH|nr:putative oxidoreductase [Rosa chinensis]